MSTFTSVLKKIGTILATVSGDIAQIMGFPFIASILQGAGKAGSVVNTVLGDFSSIAQIISIIEAGSTAVNGAGTQTGSQKLAAAAPIVQQLIISWASSNLPGHNKIKDAAKLAAAAQGITSNFADALNAFGD
jgi:hypothetical protein